MKKSVTARALSAAASIFALALTTAHAQAQDAQPTPQDSNNNASPAADDDGETIIVTGSRIRRAGFDTDQPAVVVGSQLIEKRGYTNIGEALSSQPAFAVPASNAVGAQDGGSISAGQSFADFFGLGSQRTLTLVNGRRFIGSNTSSIFGPTDAGTQVDLNVIPTKLIDRIETIAVGGAPIYGSDAISGTVNIILKRDYEGIDLDAQYGLADRGDARNYRIRGLAGMNFADGRGNITVSGEYNKSAGLLSTDRRLSAQQRFFASRTDPSDPFRQSLAFNRRLPSITSNGVPTVNNFIVLGPNAAQGFGMQPGVTDAQGNLLSFNQLGQLVNYDLGQETGGLTDFIGGDGFNLAEVTNLLSPTERYSANALFQYQFSDSIRFFGEGWYSSSKASVLRAQPVYNSALFSDPNDPLDASGNLTIPLSNPYLTDAQRSAILAAIASNPASDQNMGAGTQDYFYLGRANTDLISGLSSSRVQVYRFVAGFDGTFDLGGRDIKWEVVGNYGRSKSKGQSRELVHQNFLNALNSTTDGNGNIICDPSGVNSPIQTISSVCAPFNPFGQQNSQAVRDYITTIANPTSVNTQKVFTASLSGDAFQLPGGALSFAFGYEHREEKARFDPGAFLQGGPDPDPLVDSNGDGDPTNDRVSFGRSVPIDPVRGKFNTDEVFGELHVPIVGPNMNVPFVHALSANGAVRYVDNSLAGGDVTYTLGGAWQPVADLTIRGNYTRSIRAPAITELFNPSSGIFTFADDPCDVDFIGDGPAPATRAANCASQGIPTGFQSLIADASQRGSLIGNPNLENEKANSYTIGAVFRPSFAPGLTMSVDWVSIKLRNAILALDADQVFAACYDSADFPNEYCGRIDRNLTAGDPNFGQVQFVRTGFANAAAFDYKGILAEVAYRFPTPFLGSGSRVDVGVNYQYVDKLEQRVGLGDLTILRGDAGYSKHKATGNLTYSNDGFSWFWQAQYFGKAEIDPNAAPNTYNISKVDDVVYVNSSVTYDIDERFTLSLFVDNVFDTGMPSPSPAGGGTVTYFQGLLGRTFKVGAGVKF